jgi:hypothetical protein
MRLNLRSSCLVLFSCPEGHDAATGPNAWNCSKIFGGTSARFLIYKYPPERGNGSRALCKQVPFRLTFGACR